MRGRRGRKLTCLALRRPLLALANTTIVLNIVSTAGASFAARNDFVAKLRPRVASVLGRLEVGELGDYGPVDLYGNVSASSACSDFFYGSSRQSS